MFLDYIFLILGVLQTSAVVFYSPFCPARTQADGIKIQAADMPLCAGTEKASLLLGLMIIATALLIIILRKIGFFSSVLGFSAIIYGLADILLIYLFPLCPAEGATCHNYAALSLRLIGVALIITGVGFFLRLMIFPVMTSISLAASSQAQKTKAQNAGEIPEWKKHYKKLQEETINSYATKRKNAEDSADKS